MPAGGCAGRSRGGADGYSRAFRGAAQAAGTCTDDMGMVGARRRHVHRGHTRGVLGAEGRDAASCGALLVAADPGEVPGPSPHPWLTRPDPAQPTVPRRLEVAAPVTCSSLIIT